MIGVFVNKPIEVVVEVAHVAGLDGIQLHGDETSAYCENLKEALPQLLVIKAFNSESAENSQMIRDYPVDAIMIDAFDKRLHGGTGQLADWAFAKRVAGGVPRLILAGGLSAGNVAAAIEAVKPFAVDACSSLEVSPGKKSARLMREFVDAVRMSKLQTEGN
jgi:phosphoribosylanthranilate isomerase